jgi:Integrase core domain
MRVDQALRLNEPETENGGLKTPVADLSSDNATNESFNGSFRDECLNVNWFLSMEDAGEDREVAAGLQRVPAARFARRLDSKAVR